jgi:hypothetical protein
MVTKAPSLLALTEIMMVFVLLVITFYGITFYFIGSVRKTMRKVPSSLKTFSSELIWFMLVPVIGYLITWILLPFTIPRSMRKALQDQGSASWEKVISLSRFGMLRCLLALLCFVTFFWILWLSHQNFSAPGIIEHSVIATVLFLVCLFAKWLTFIVYWKKLVNIRVDLDLAGERRLRKEAP